MNKFLKKSVLSFSLLSIVVSSQIMADGISEASQLACKTVDVGAYYMQYDEANKMWAYVSSDASLVLALNQGATTADMNKGDASKMWLIHSEFETAPVISADGKNVTFGALKGGTCGTVTDYPVAVDNPTAGLEAGDITPPPIPARR